MIIESLQHQEQNPEGMTYIFHRSASRWVVCGQAERMIMLFTAYHASNSDCDAGA